MPFGRMLDRVAAHAERSERVRRGASSFRLLLKYTSYTLVVYNKHILECVFVHFLKFTYLYFYTRASQARVDALSALSCAASSLYGTVSLLVPTLSLSSLFPSLYSYITHASSPLGWGDPIQEKSRLVYGAGYQTNGIMAHVPFGYSSPNLSRYHARYATALGSKFANVQNANAHPARVCVATAKPVHSITSPK